MSVLNSTVLQRCWLAGSTDFQQRIDNPSISGYSSAIEQLFEPYNADMFNEFSRLLNGLTATYVDILRFENPLAVLKKPASQVGFSERHIAIHYLECHSYKFDTETLLKVEKPEFESWYYSLNTERRYEFSWSRFELMQAFAQDGYGYDDLLSGTISQMLSTAAYDEMNIMLQTFAEADNRMGGLFRYHLSAAPTDESTAKELLKGIRTVAGEMRFPSMRYNHLPVPVHTDGSRLILYVLPSVLASLDVDALSGVFQLDKAEVQYRIIMVPEFPIPNVYAILADEDFIYYRDFMTGMEPPFYNPENRTYKYYYFANAAVGCNPAAPVCCFSTDAGTGIKTITFTPSGIAFSPDSGNVEQGGTLDTHIYMQGSLAASDSGSTDPIGVEPDAAIYTLSAVDDNNDAFNLNSRTYVDAHGILHVQKSIPVGSVITITAKACYINPSGSTSSYTDTFAATVVAPS